MLSHIQSDFYTRDYCIITLFLNCGMRLSELAGMDIGDIEFDRESVIVSGKGNKDRRLHLNAKSIDAIQE